MTTQRFWSGSPWESKAGYCRAIRVDDRIWVSGTGPFRDGELVHPGDPARQAERCFEIVLEALAELGSAPEHVVAVRMYVTDIGAAAEFSEAHRRAFGAYPPTSTLIQVSALVHPEMLIEVEAEAIVREAV